MATKSNNTANAVKNASNAGVKALSNSAHKFDAYREDGQNAAKGKLHTLLRFQRDVSENGFTAADAEMAVDTYSLGVQDVTGLPLAKASRGAMISTLSKFADPVVVKVTAEINKLTASALASGKFPKKETGKDAFTAHYAMANAVVANPDKKLDATFVSKALAKGESNRSKKAAAAEAARDPRKDAIAAIDEALKVLGVVKNPKRRAALAEFKKAFGIELHFWA